MFAFGRAWASIRKYFDATDPYVAASNAISFVIVANQPPYPLYIWWIVGDDHYLSLLTFLSTPLFAAVPAVCRRWPVAGRAMLPLVGAVNTVFCGFVFGSNSGVEWFFLACLLIALLAFRWSERTWATATTLVVAGLYAAFHGRYPVAVSAFDATAYASFNKMNAISTAGLCVFALYQFFRARQASSQIVPPTTTP